MQPLNSNTQYLLHTSIFFNRNRHLLIEMQTNLWQNFGCCQIVIEYASGCSIFLFKYHLFLSDTKFLQNLSLCHELMFLYLHTCYLCSGLRAAPCLALLYLPCICSQTWDQAHSAGTELTAHREVMRGPQSSCASRAVGTVSSGAPCSTAGWAAPRAWRGWSRAILSLRELQTTSLCYILLYVLKYCIWNVLKKIIYTN